MLAAVVSSSVIPEFAKETSVFETVKMLVELKR